MEGNALSYINDKHMPTSCKIEQLVHTKTSKYSEISYSSCKLNNCDCILTEARKKKKSSVKIKIKRYILFLLVNLFDFTIGFHFIPYHKPETNHTMSLLIHSPKISFTDTIPDRATEKSLAREIQSK